MNEFKKLLELISTKSPFQKKRLAALLLSSDSKFVEDADSFSRDYLSFLSAQGIPVEEVVAAYLKLCSDITGYQIEFARTGIYPALIPDAMPVNIYYDKHEMTSYMIGLALSQFLWKTHYEMYSFFSENISSVNGHVNAYLEIGPGHGVYLKKALECLKKDVPVCAVDVSATSIAITESIIRFFMPDRRYVSYCVSDILKWESKDVFDFICMGQVLEHVHQPSRLLDKAYSLLAPGGQVFISTCVDAPEVDHVYHFHDVEEIRKLIIGGGFHVLSEKVLPVEALPMEEVIAKKITINYCAMIAKRNL